MGSRGWLVGYKLHCTPIVCTAVIVLAMHSHELDGEVLRVLRCFFSFFHLGACKGNQGDRVVIST